MLFIFALTALRALEPRIFSEDIIVSKMCVVTMVTSQLTVPCNSLGNLYSHVHLCFSVNAQHGSAIHRDSYAAKHAHPFFCQKSFTSAVVES